MQAFEFDATGAFVKTFDGSNTLPGTICCGYTSVAIDNTSGRIYIVDTAHERVDAFDSAGNFFGEISGTPGNANDGVAVGQATGNVYVSDNVTQAVKIFGPPIVAPDVTTDPPSNIGLASATLNGTVNPDNEGNATCQFLWGPD